MMGFHSSVFDSALFDEHLLNTRHCPRDWGGGGKNKIVKECFAFVSFKSSEGYGL